MPALPLWRCACQSRPGKPCLAQVLVFLEYLPVTPVLWPGVSGSGSRKMNRHALRGPLHPRSSGKRAPAHPGLLGGSRHSLPLQSSFYSDFITFHSWSSLGAETALNTDRLCITSTSEELVPCRILIYLTTVVMLTFNCDG